jgi:hypothetical protein
VRPTPAFSWLLIFLIPLTFTWKLVAEPAALYDTVGSITRFLSAHDFYVSEQAPVEGTPIVRATKGDCSMVVADASSSGAKRYIMDHFARTMDRQFVVFRGDVYDGQPTWLTITQEWWATFLRKLGISRSQAPPIVVAAASSCAAERLPWERMSDVGPARP